MYDTFITITELAQLLGVRSYQVRYAHMQGHLPEPRRVAGRRVYRPAEVEHARRYAEQHELAGRRRGRPVCSQDNEPSRQHCPEQQGG